MKSINTLFLLFIFLNLKAVENPYVKPLPKIVDGKTIPNVKPILGDHLYMAETEVTNQQYKDFLTWLKKNKPEKYKSNLTDTAKWRSGINNNEPYVNYYFQHKAYNNYPLVNITQKQAINYCNWLHDSLEKYFALKKSKIDKFIVRLPTEKEWMMAARGGLPETAVYPWEGNGIRMIKGRNKGYILLNSNRGYVDYSGRLDDFSFVTVDVTSYWPNGFGLYNMSGQ